MLTSCQNEGLILTIDAPRGKYIMNGEMNEWLRRLSEIGQSIID